jgi:uncharacterized RDD family membrane protein YckC
VPETDADADDYPGQRLGLPKAGPGSVAGYGRRLVALFIDWFVALALASIFVGGEVWTGEGAGLWAPLVTLAVYLTLLDGLLGYSIGRRILSLALIRIDGRRPVGIPRALLRSVLLCLAIPALVNNPDRRGLHDLAAGTVVVRT